MVGVENVYKVEFDGGILYVLSVYNSFFYQLEYSFDWALCRMVIG